MEESKRLILKSYITEKKLGNTGGWVGWNQNIKVFKVRQKSGFRRQQEVIYVLEQEVT